MKIKRTWIWIFFLALPWVTLAFVTFSMANVIINNNYSAEAGGVRATPPSGDSVTPTSSPRIK